MITLIGLQQLIKLRNKLHEHINMIIALEKTIRIVQHNIVFLGLLHRLVQILLQVQLPLARVFLYYFCIHMIKYLQTGGGFNITIIQTGYFEYVLDELHSGEILQEPFLPSNRIQIQHDGLEKVADVLYLEVPFRDIVILPPILQIKGGVFVAQQHALELGQQLA